MDEKRMLEGIRVVEFSTYVAAPICGAMLADLGAEVIKIEAPSGDLMRPFLWPQGKGNVRFDSVNGEKKSITINLKAEGGIKALQTLAASADVFLTNTRLKSLVKNGLDAETLCAMNPKLIYAWLSGCGDKGPEADLPAFDSSTYWAKSGLLIDTMVDTGNSRPTANPIAGGDRVTGLAMFGLIMAALYRRAVTGKGDYVTTSLFHVGMYQNAFNIIGAQDGYTFPRKYGKTAAENEMFKCADGRWVLLAVMNWPKQGRALCSALGKPELFDDPRFEYPEKKSENRQLLLEIFSEIMAQKTSDEWAEVFGKHDIACCILADSYTVQKSEQAWANDYFEKYTTSQGKEYVVVRSLINMASQPKPYIHDVPEEIGADTEAILGALGLSEEEIRKASK